MFRHIVGMTAVRLGARRPSEDGATATEYGILVGFLAFAIILGVTAFGVSVDNWYDAMAATVDGLTP